MITQHHAGRVLFAVLGLCVASLTAQAATEPCADGTGSTLLAPDRSGIDDARAYWLDRNTVRWPGVHGRVLLALSRAGSLVARPGAVLVGAERRWELPRGRANPNAEQRFAFVKQDGPDLRVPAEAERLAESAQVALIALDADGRITDATYLQTPGLLDDLYGADASGPPLGALVQPSATRWRVWAPTARALTLCRFDRLEGGKATTVSMQRQPASGTWSAMLPLRAHGDAYVYSAEVFVRSVGWVRNRVIDPWSAALTADSLRSVAVDLDDPALQPAGWRHAKRPAAPTSLPDMTIYELHVRDFSIGDAAVAERARGGYLAFSDPRSSGMRHLQGLARAGLRDVHLLPVFDIASIPERGCKTPSIPEAPPDSDQQQAAVTAVASRDCFNWGYDPLHYGVPEGSYSSDAAKPFARVVEFRRMVLALHRIGLRVGIDVVYNHTPAAGQDAHAVLDRLVPGYYQRLDANGKVETSTCCSNTATEHRMMARLMRDTLTRWVHDYHIDSFRFDLMGHQPKAEMLAAQSAVNAAAGRWIPFIGEGWNFGEIAEGKRFVQAAQLPLAGSGIGSFNDRLRDAARGGGCCDSGEALLAEQGWLTGLVTATNGRTRGGAAGGQVAASTPSADPNQSDVTQLRHAADLIRAGLAGSLRAYRMQGQGKTLAELDYKGQPAGYVDAPGEAVNYVENHDNPTLFDIGVMKLPVDTPSSERARVQVLGMALVALAQGTPYLHAGVELMRSKSLDRNSFDSGDWFNRIDWNGRDNTFGSGLPPKPDNGKDWPLLAPLLRSVAPPAAADMRYTRDALRELLEIRAGSSLFRLRSASEVQSRLQFPTDANTDPTVITGLLDGRGKPDAGFDGIVYLLNTAPAPRDVPMRQASGQAWRLHPVQAAGGDARIRNEARWDANSAKFHIPGRSAVVFVLERR